MLMLTVVSGFLVPSAGIAGVTMGWIQLQCCGVFPLPLLAVPSETEPSQVKPAREWNSHYERHNSVQQKKSVECAKNFSPASQA